MFCFHARQTLYSPQIGSDTASGEPYFLTVVGSKICQQYSSRFLLPQRHVIVTKAQLLSYSISRLSDAAAARMDDALNAKLFSGRYFIMMGTRRQSAIYSVRRFYLGIGGVRGRTF